MDLVTRAQWGARSPSRGRNRIKAKPLGTAVHWNGPSCAALVRDHDQCAEFVRGIQDFHMDKRRWSDIAYTDFACPHGFLFEGRGEGVGTAANGTDYGNENYYAVYAIWGKGDGPVPEAMLGAICDAVSLHRSWGAGDKVTTHRALYATECPGVELTALVKTGYFDRGQVSAPRSKPPVSKPTTKFVPLWKPTGKMSVAEIQKAVGVTPDGMYGHDTKAAVARYQEQLGVAVDGFWGKGSERAHRRMSKASRAAGSLLRRWSKGARVRRLQKGLNRVFPAYSKLRVDGVYGPATERTVKEFQRRSGLAPDGIVGANTRKALARYGIKA